MVTTSEVAMAITGTTAITETMGITGTTAIVIAATIGPMTIPIGAIRLGITEARISQVEVVPTTIRAAMEHLGTVCAVAFNWAISGSFGNR